MEAEVTSNSQSFAADLMANSIYGICENIYMSGQAALKSSYKKDVVLSNITPFPVYCEKKTIIPQ